ncbi:transposable element Tcb1 transposase [Trichonephila clavipes]|nr:transposable element Tcb1 transposase [Trichonephila clavipes]
MGVEFLFIDDNARPHRANIVDECLQSDDITRMDWPAYSPDLNPIEHVRNDRTSNWKMGLAGVPHRPNKPDLNHRLLKISIRVRKLTTIWVASLRGP